MEGTPTAGIVYSSAPPQAHSEMLSARGLAAAPENALTPRLVRPQPRSAHDSSRATGVAGDHSMAALIAPCRSAQLRSEQRVRGKVPPIPTQGVLRHREQWEAPWVLSLMQNATS